MFLLKRPNAPTISSMNDEPLTATLDLPLDAENVAPVIPLTSAQDDTQMSDDSVDDEPATEPDVSPPENHDQPPEESSELTLLKEVSSVMKDDPAINSMLDVVRQTPDIFAEIQPALARRDEFEATEAADELHRTLTPLLAGIAMSRRGNELLSLALEHHTSEEAKRLWELVKSGDSYVSELVIGSGIHAQIYNSLRMSDDPSVPALTVEASETTGGQFAETEGPVFRTNTRTRPENPALPNVPGSAGSLNNYEGPGVLQQSDITGLAYGSNDTLGLPARVNHMLYSKIINETDVVRVEDNDPAVSKRPGLYAVVLKNKETGEEQSVTTDRIVFASGLGEPETGFETADAQTKAIIEEEFAKYERGEDAQVMTFHHFAKRVGDESDPFPLKPFEWVAVVGPGDSGAVTVEYLLGYGPDTRMSAAQLDRVKEVFWIGQKAQTREELSKVTRLRYINLSLEMPLDSESDYAHRITPINGRAYKLERTEDGRIRVLHGIKAEDGSINPTGEVVVDHLILATGFTKKTDEICASVLDKIDSDTKDEELTTDTGWAVAKRYKGTQIYKIGPAAELLVSSKDVSDSPAMRKEGGRGKEIAKTVAVWASSEETAETARMLGPVEAGADRPPSLTTHESAAIPDIELSEFSADSTPQTTQLKMDVPKAAIHSLLRHDAVSEDITRLAVDTSLHEYIFPANLEGLRLTARQLGKTEELTSFEVTVEPSLPETTEYIKMLGDVLSEPMLQAVLVRLTDRSVHSAQTVVLDIPFNSRKVSTGEVEIRVKRR